MPEISNQQIEKLSSLASALQAFVDSFEATRVEVPPEIAAVRDRLVADGVCLRCLQQRGGKYTRGQCANCYNITNKEITSHEVSLNELVKIGRLMEPRKSGRKGMRRLPSSQLNDIVQATGGLKNIASDSPSTPSPQDLSRPLTANEQAATEDTAKMVNVAAGMKLAEKAGKKAKGKK